MHGVEDEIGFVLRLAQLAVFKDVIETLSPFSLRPSDFSALRVISANPGLKQQDNGRELGIRDPTWSGMVEDLRQKKLIVRKVVPGDRRSYSLTLTSAGRELLDQAEDAPPQPPSPHPRGPGDNDSIQFLACLHNLAHLTTETGE
ncbi:MAG: MarR family transcriptional regulator [Caulobacteraceae bacterium]